MAQVFVIGEPGPERPAGTRFVEGNPVVVDHLVTEVETGGKISAQEVGLGEAQVDLALRARQRETEAQVLAAPEQVAFPDADVAERSHAGRKAGAEGQIAGRLLLDRDTDEGLVGRAAPLGLDVDGPEKAEVADALARSAQLGGVEGVALDQPELAPDHPVEGALVALDVDALDEDLRSLLNLEGYVNQAVFTIAIFPGPDVDEGVAHVPDHLGQVIDRLLDLLFVVPFALLGGHVPAQRFGFQPWQRGRGFDLAELLTLTLLDREGDDEALAVGQQFRDHRQHAKIGIALLPVETAQQLAVEVQAVRIVSVVGGQDEIEGGLDRGDLVLQL